MQMDIFVQLIVMCCVPTDMTLRRMSVNPKLHGHLGKSYWSAIDVAAYRQSEKVC